MSDLQIDVNNEVKMKFEER